MYISFYLDEEFYSGEVSEKEIGNILLYEVDLGKRLQFSIVMGDDARWVSDDPVNPSIVKCAGSEIEWRDQDFQSAPIHPKKYYSL
jgi:hypothetical protein